MEPPLIFSEIAMFVHSDLGGQLRLTEESFLRGICGESSGHKEWGELCVFFFLCCSTLKIFRAWVLSAEQPDINPYRCVYLGDWV